jgi:hypothetical protein
MRFCTPHWNALREEIENKRGLQQFVSRSGKEMASKAAEALAGGISMIDFDSLSIADIGDPLMDGHNVIVGNAVKLLDGAGAPPMWLFTANEDGTDKCPLCVVSACEDPNCTNGCRERGTTWIEFAGRDVAEMWADRLKGVTQ